MRAVFKNNYDYDYRLCQLLATQWPFVSVISMNRWSCFLTAQRLLTVYHILHLKPEGNSGILNSALGLETFRQGSRLSQVVANLLYIILEFESLKVQVV